VTSQVVQGKSDLEPDGGPSFSQFARRNLGEEVTRYMRNALLSGRYRAGAKMAVNPLAQTFKTSSMPVREALLTLAGEELLEANPRRGVQVARTSVRDVQDVFVVHAFVAGLLAEEATLLFDDCLVERLVTLQNQIEMTFARNLARKGLLKERPFHLSAVTSESGRGRQTEGESCLSGRVGPPPGLAFRR
jgi:DNA-binding GntR family transcriptional regulator